MKNKIAERAKKKRRAEKEAAKKAEQDEIMRKFSKVAKEKGLKKYKRNAVLRAWKETDNILTERAIVYSIVIVAYCLHKYYGWGTSRLRKFAHASHKYLHIAGSQSRSILQLKEEMEIEAGVDFRPLDEYEPKYRKVNDPKDDEGKIIAQKIPYIMPMIIFTLYFDEGWKSKRMNRLVGQVMELLDSVIVRNEIETLRRTLIKECKLRFCDDGAVYLIEKGDA